MRRLRLSTLLIGINVGLLLVAAAGIALIATRFLRDLAAHVDAGTSPATIDGLINQFVLELVIVTVGVAILSGILSWLAARRLSEPLQTLNSAAARIGHGDLNTPVPTADGFEIGSLSTTLEDMRRRLLQSTATLRRQQAESNAIITGIVEGVFTVNRERRIQYLNPQAAASLGIAPETAIGRFCGDVLRPQGENGIRPCEEQCPIIHARFRTGARATEHLQLANGQHRTVVITSAPPPTESHSIEADVRQVQVMRDETEEEATRRMRDAILANISHEFRTPLSAQLASIELLLDQLPDLTTTQVASLVISLQRGTLRLTQLIDNLLESVRIESGRFTIRQKLLVIDDVIEQALEFTRPLFDQRQQEVIVELPYPLPPLSGDAQRLTQVFVNLLANANKFSETGDTIRIGARVELGSVTVWVEDQGPGLPGGDESLFVPFMRSQIEEPEAKGIGLGLWIVKSIVERHGGQVSAESTSEGTRISITLPVNELVTE